MRIGEPVPVQTWERVTVALADVAALRRVVSGLGNSGLSAVITVELDVAGATALARGPAGRRAPSPGGLVDTGPVDRDVRRAGAGASLPHRRRSSGRPDSFDGRLARDRDGTGRGSRRVAGRGSGPAGAVRRGRVPARRDPGAGSRYTASFLGGTRPNDDPDEAHRPRAGRRTRRRAGAVRRPGAQPDRCRHRRAGPARLGRRPARRRAGGHRAGDARRTPDRRRRSAVGGLTARRRPRERADGDDRRRRARQHHPAPGGAPGPRPARLAPCPRGRGRAAAHPDPGLRPAVHQAPRDGRLRAGAGRRPDAPGGRGRPRLPRLRAPRRRRDPGRRAVR